MGLWSTIFGNNTLVDKSTDALINAGDKLFYTDEEKAEMKHKAIELHIKLLEASHPFKLVQRVLAIWYSFLFGVAFLVGLAMSIYNIFIKYNFIATDVIKEPRLLDIEPLIRIVGAFGLGGIVLAIVVFYFGGGTLESLKSKFPK